jgi:hypothetical protein
LRRCLGCVVGTLMRTIKRRVFESVKR